MIRLIIMPRIFLKKFLLIPSISALVGLSACGGCEEKEPQDLEIEVEDMSAQEDASSSKDMDVVDAMPPVDASMDMFQEVDLGPIPDNPLVYEVARGCFTVSATMPEDTSASTLTLSVSGDGQSFEFSEGAAEPVLMQPSDLATYLIYDSANNYMVVDEDHALFERKEKISSAILEVDDAFLPGAQWVLQASPRDASKFNLKHLKSDYYLTTTGISRGIQNAALIELTPAEGCAEYPELSIDAVGDVYATPFEDGSVYGIVETHSHILSNFGFGGGGLFHGSAFHPFGVEHALPSCEQFHGEEGRRDLFGFGFDQGSDIDQDVLLTGLISGRTPEFNHFTDGYPTFTTWPNAHKSSTHQTQYYRWIERAYLGGLRLMVQHATTNKIICDLIAGQNTQPTRYSCNDMVNVDRIIEETYRMERYIDALHGGPGKGWFRIVTSPEQAREVINEGKMAIVLGIETSHLFDCFLTPPEGMERCTEQDVVQKLDEYWDKGVRVLFPVHKYDNGFSAGDGSKVLIEVGNFAQSGHWSNFTLDCPDVPTAFDKGNVGVSGLNQPRDEYLSDPPNDLSNFSKRPVATLLNYSEELQQGSLEGDYCQNAGLTNLGEFLISEMMKRGMIIEIDHLPRRSYIRAFDMLEASDYPAVGSHGNTYNGRIFDVGGVSKISFGRCSDPENPAGRLASFKNDLSMMDERGMYVAEGVGFDLNGFAGGIGPRFGEDSNCQVEQMSPVAYPFTSYDGAITFGQPFVGDRQIDFNTEGFVHIGMLPELIEDLKHDGATDEDLEPMFRSAEGYLRMWEKAEQRSVELGSE